MIVDLAKTILRENGLPEIDFEISHVSLETVTLEGIRIGQAGALKIPRISAVFTWRELIDGEVGKIAVDDLELTVVKHDGGLSFGELDPFVYGGTEDADSETAIGSFNWPFRELTLGNARITLVEGDAAIVSLSIDGTVQRGTSGGLEIGPAHISATSPEISLAAGIAASVSRDGNLTAGMKLEHGIATIQGYEIKAEDGGLSIETPLDDLSRLEALATLQVSEVALPFGLLTKGSLALGIGENQLNATLRAEDTVHGLTAGVDVAASLADPLAVQPIKIEVSLSALDAELFPPGLLPLALTHGAASLRVSLEDTIGNLQALADVDGLLSLAAAVPDLQIELKGSGLESLALPGRADIDARFLTGRGDSGAITLHAPAGIRAALIPSNDNDWLAMLGPLRQSDLVSPLQITIQPRENQPLLQFSPGLILQKASFDGVMRVEGGALPALDAGLSVSGIVDPQAGIFDASVDRLSLSVEQAVIDTYTLSGIAVDFSAKATELAASGSARLALGISGGDPETLFIPSGKANFPLSWQYSDDTLNLSLRDCAEVRLPTLQNTDIHIDMRTIRFCLRDDGTDILKLTRSREGDQTSATVNARLSIQGRDIVLTRPDGWRARLSGRGNEARVNAHLSPTGTVDIKSEASLGAVTLASELLFLSGIRLSAESKNIEDELSLNVEAAVTDMEKPRRFAPMDLTINSTASNTDALAATGEIAARDTPLKIEWEAEHRLSTRKGRATLRIIPFEFGYGVNRLADITSLLDGVVSRPSGHLLGAASANWADGAGCANADVLIRQPSVILPGTGPIPLQGEVSMGQLGLTGKICADENGILSQAGQLLLDGMKFNGDQVSARAVNANIDIASFHPFTTAAEQVLSVGVVDIGFPLTDGTAVFDITDTSQFSLNALDFNWAGGKVSVAPFEIAPDRPLQAVDLSVEGAQLEKLTELIPDKGVAGKGILDGMLPIRFTDDGPAVDQGYLTARGPGVLRYKRTLEEGAEASAVDDVLSNLQYSELRMDIDGGLRGGVTIGLHVEGTNPDYLDGYPVVLDVNVNGPLGAIMNDGLATYKVPSQILERMRRFGQIQ
ncbi:intermembrane phospholipid transport protein YdbH family protein [Hwanghaeella sp.]|uniref:intermembrane phospholipid transport protein YdbH family protein n=1 Tax=Hwanghaeella sp. TaxID=2605943 RepID=UPI003CCBE7AD